MNIAIVNRQRTRKINLRLLKQVAQALFAELELEKAEIGICLVAAPEMTRLNETFLRHAGSTDVITFDYSVPKPRARDPRPEIHGEVFMCADEAVVQARKFGTSWQSELVRYLVHGTLHLTGHDDRRPAVRRRMKREENRLLEKLSRRFALAQLARPASISA
jgi:probable rRNA maturation factor